jgi:hypothetical protein
MNKNLKNIVVLIIGVSALCAVAQAKSRKPASGDQSVACANDLGTAKINYTIPTKVTPVAGVASLPLSNITIVDNGNPTNVDLSAVTGYFLDEMGSGNPPALNIAFSLPQADGSVTHYEVNTSKIQTNPGVTELIYKGTGLFGATGVKWTCTISGSK